jgi:hypothetical protein
MMMVMCAVQRSTNVCAPTKCDDGLYLDHHHRSGVQVCVVERWSDDDVEPACVLLVVLFYDVAHCYELELS